MPLVSVCIPTYNGELFLAEALESVLKQTFTDFELIVCDDASTDRSEEIAASVRDPRVRVERNPVRSGLVGNWNRCLTHARGEFVTVFHQDDRMLLHHLEDAVTLLRSHPNIGFVHSRPREIDNQGRLLDQCTWSRDSTDAVVDGRQFVTAMLQGPNIVCCPTVMMRRTCYEQLGLFDARLPYTADWEMWMRIALIWDVAYLAEPRVEYRWHGRNETFNFYPRSRGVKQCIAAKRLLIEKYPERVPDLEGQRKSIRRYQRRDALNIMRECLRRREFTEALKCAALLW
ncbi:MAG: glycosyltransferase [Candidatus Peribacteraceae bacterium]|nr:glycosyltransferase [Candidatus Peribacteraceae bacterium]